MPRRVPRQAEKPRARGKRSPAALRTLLRARAGVRLDIGCGSRKPGPDWVGIDRRPLPGVDIVHDLWEFPWPLPDGCARVVLMSHYWEHIPPHLTMRTMEEIHRITQPGGSIFIAAPYGTGYRFVQDPTHCNPSNEITWQYWDNRNPLWQVYQPPVFHVMGYSRIPAGGDVDFNCVLQRCREKGCDLCPAT